MATRDEAALLLRASRTAQGRLYMPLFILLGIYTGRRKEAILSLRWPQVKLDTQTINFEIAGRRRTNKRRGVVRIAPELLRHLKRARRRGTDMGYVLHIDGKRIGDIKKGFVDRRHASYPSPHGSDLVDAEGHRSVASGRLPVDEHGNIAACLCASSPGLPARSRREYRQTSAECPRNRLMFSLRSVALNI